MADICIISFLHFSMPHQKAPDYSLGFGTTKKDLNRELTFVGVGSQPQTWRHTCGGVLWLWCENRGQELPTFSPSMTHFPSTHATVRLPCNPWTLRNTHIADAGNRMQFFPNPILAPSLRFRFIYTQRRTQRDRRLRPRKAGIHALVIQR